ncbi:hypothetical protein M0R72_20580 [Candidatus Pacearchaeota archaeon]|jgi:hypothetical protein|nr:hypothetical protein [Candidatus Pacearchaeota archaeon]
MQQCDNPISTFLVDAKEYQDLTERARLVDRLQDGIVALRQELQGLKNDFMAYREMAERDRALDRQRISKLEHPHEPQDPKILDDLHKEMLAMGRKQVDFATAARMVKRSKSRMLQLKGMIGQDMRFILVPSESHSQKVLIRLR